MEHGLSGLEAEAYWQYSQNLTVQATEFRRFLENLLPIATKPLILS